MANFVKKLRDVVGVRVIENVMVFSFAWGEGGGKGKARGGAESTKGLNIFGKKN